jgi:hypothetical protein
MSKPQFLVFFSQNPILFLQPLNYGVQALQKFRGYVHEIKKLPIFPD